MNKKRYIVLVIAIVSFGLALTGGTYAFLFWNAEVTNNTYVGESSVFDFEYSYTNDDGSSTAINGVLAQTSYPTGGLHGKITMNAIASNLTDASGFIYLNVGSGTSSKLYSTVTAHCENPDTLETMAVYTSSSTCASAGHTWVTTGSALKYALYRVADVTYSSLVKKYSLPVAVGHIKGTGEITVREKFVLGSKEQEYNLYIWLDGELANSSYSSLTFSGSVRLGANQVEMLYGDVDENGSITSNDMSTITIFANTGNASALGLTDQGALNADVNADGFVDLVDAHIIASSSFYSGYLPDDPVPIYDIEE